MKPEIIIHGASSFLGRNFLGKLIAEKIPVTVLAREQSVITVNPEYSGIEIIRYKKDLSELNKELIQVHAPVFFEFSWHGVFGTERNDPDQFAINIPLIISSVRLAHQLRSKHWVGIGSQAEYGAADKPLRETDECHPTTLYGKSKLICSQVSAELCRAYDMEHSWLRLFSVYGPNDNHDWLIQYLIREMLQDHEIEVTKGEQVWDYLYIDDITRMLMKLKDASGAGIANLGSGKGTRVKYIIEKIKELCESSSTIYFGKIPYRPDQVMLMEADITKLSTHLDWKPTTSIEEGLRKTIQFTKSFIS